MLDANTKGCEKTHYKAKDSIPTGWVFSFMEELSAYMTSGARNWSKYYSDKGALFNHTRDIKTNALNLSDVARMELDQSILSKAFRGELVPQDPNDEPASELLARIRATREAEAAAKKAGKKKTAKKRAKKKSSG